MAIRLELHTEDPEEIAFIQRYWATDEDGAFIEKVNELVPFREITQGGAIAAFVRQRCTAYDQNQPCKTCGAPIEISSRSEFRKQPPVRAFAMCKACQQAALALRQEQEIAAAAELAVRLAEYAEALNDQTCDYRALGDDLALVVLALEAAITPRLTTGTFSVKDCEALCAGDAGPYVQRLLEAGVLMERPLEAEAGTYYLKDDSLWIRRAQAVYALAPDPNLGSANSVLEVVSNRELTDGHALAQLWLDYAVQDVMHYFMSECHTYNHELSAEELLDIQSSFRSALGTYSVAQLWSVAWRVVRDAASLANRTYYNREKAAATLPGKVRRHMEKVDREAAPLRAWARREEHPAGTLGMVFWELFEIDENATGADALLMFSRIGLQAEVPACEAALLAPATELMRAAVAENRVPEILLEFAALIGGGVSVPEAIRSIRENHPALGGK